MKPIQEIYPHLSTPRKVVITMHQKPDADAMGSSLALFEVLTQLGHSVTVISPTNWPDFLQWMPGCNHVLDFEARKEQSEARLHEAEWIFCLDFNTLKRTKKMETVLVSVPGQRILIDHHQQPQLEMFAYGVSNACKSSTAEMVYDFILESGHEKLINDAVAQCLYAGVMTDTGSFRFESTTASVHEMVANLKHKGLLHHRVHEQIFDTFLENRLRFLGYVLLNRLTVDYELNTALLAVSKADLLRFDIKTGDTKDLANYPLSLLGIRLAAIVIDRDEERKWSFRSKGNVDVNRFARQHFDGGGHMNAAGGRSLQPLSETVEYFWKAVKELSDVLAE